MAGNLRARAMYRVMPILPLVLSVAGLGAWASRGTPVAVTGTVRFEGTPPAAERPDLSSDPYCAQANADGLEKRDVTTGSGGGLRDVIVYVKEGSISRAGTAPTQAVMLDQQNCAYAPHALALRAGQQLRIRNSDRTLHNVHVKPAKNREFNIGQPIQGMETPRTFAVPEVGIVVTCDIHGWMSGVIAVFDHDHFAVTGTDGAFDLGDLPPGDYVIEAWHETLGAQQQTVTVAAGASPALTFTFRTVPRLSAERGWR